MSGVTTVQIKSDDNGMRLDRWFRRDFPGLSHGRLEKLLRTGQVRLDGKRVKANSRLTTGQAIRIPPLDAEALPRPAGSKVKVDRGEAQRLRQQIIHMDPAVIVLNKPPGLAVQGGTGTRLHIDAMLDSLKFESQERPRLVHRLDKDTSGVLVLARTVSAARFLTRAFRDKSARKIYWALVAGQPEPEMGTIKAALQKSSGSDGDKVRIDERAGKPAQTDYAILDHAGTKASWLALNPLTGRTHQLRVHCAAIGAPILGDGKYGGRPAFPAGAGIDKRLHLHACEIDIPHPTGGRLRINADAPEHFLRGMDYFGFSPGDYADPFL